MALKCLHDLHDEVKGVVAKPINAFGHWKPMKSQIACDFNWTQNEHVDTHCNNGWMINEILFAKEEKCHEFSEKYFPLN